MPYKKVTLPPGINREGTDYSAEGSWYDCDLIRFRQGRPEKIGGWTKYSQNELLGVPRSLLNWTSIQGANLMAVGSDKKLYVDLGGVYHDITPMEYKNQGTLELEMANASTYTNAVFSFDVVAGDVVRMSSDANYVGDELMTVVSVAATGAAGETIVMSRGDFSTTTSSHLVGDAAFHLEKLSSPIYPVAGSPTVLIEYLGHGLSTGDFVNFLSVQGTPTGLDKRSLFYPLFDGSTNPSGGYDSDRSTQSWVVKKVLTADYFEVEIENNATGTTDAITSPLLTGASSVSTVTSSFASGDFIKIDDEYIKITSAPSGSGPYTYTCDRGQFGSRSLDHAANSVVRAVGTSGSGVGGDTIIMRDIQASESTFTEFSGWGAGTWGGLPSATTSTTLSASLSAVATSASVTDASSFPVTGEALIDSEVISYTKASSVSLNPIVRGQYGTTGAAHASGSSIFLVDQYWTAWGNPTIPISDASSSLNVWSLDTFGEDLVGCKDRTKPFYWNTSLKMSNGYPYNTEYSTSSYLSGYASGIMLSDAVPMSSMGLSTDDGHGSVPEQVGFLMTNPASRQVISFGSSDTFGNYDPMLIRWCDVDRPGSWEPTEQNSAGGFPLQKGSSIVSGARSDKQILIWTDTSMYSMEFVGGDFVFAVQEVADSVSIASRHAHRSARGITYWMGDNNFYMTNGAAVEKVECSVLSKVFEELNYDKRQTVVAALNSLFNEIIWFYPDSSSNEPNKYVIFNYVTQAWAYGSIGRTAWSDSGIREKPNAASLNGQYESGAYAGIEKSIIYNHEDGYMADGQKMNSYVETAYFDIDDGDNSVFVDRFIPDLRGLYGDSPEITVDIKAKNYPSSALSKTRSLTISETTDVINTRLRGRTLSLKFYDSPNVTDVSGWKLGDSRIRIKPDGRR